jgi:WD40 repeat protein
VSGGGDGLTRVWDLTAADPAATSFEIEGHEAEITAVTFSPDGRWLATGSRDHDARLWEVRTLAPGSYSLVLPGHTGAVVAVQFLADNLRIVTAGQDGDARLFTPLPLDEVIARACQVAGRNLTAEEWLVYMDEGDPQPTCEEG